MAQFTTTNTGASNQPPDRIGDGEYTIENNESLLFTVNSFTTETYPTYHDPEGDDPYKLKITSLPVTGIITLDGYPVTLNEEILFDDIVTYELKYTPDVNISTVHSANFNFEISDIGSHIFFGTGNIVINILERTNEPPIIGDGFATVDYGQTKVFTVDDFTTNTTPPYYDPEGNPPFQLKIITTPNIGELHFNGVVVLENQIIDFTDIALGKLTLVGDMERLDEYDTTFRFAISDTGSQIFVE